MARKRLSEILLNENSVSMVQSNALKTDNSSLRFLAKIKATPVAIASIFIFIFGLSTYINYSNSMDKHRQEISYLETLAKNSEKIAKYTYVVKSGDLNVFKSLKDLKEENDKLLNIIKSGGDLDNNIKIDPIKSNYDGDLTILLNEWNGNNSFYSTVGNINDNISKTKNDLTTFQSYIPNLISTTDTLISQETDYLTKEKFITLKSVLESLNILSTRMFSNNQYDENDSIQFIKGLKFVSSLLLESASNTSVGKSKENINIINNLDKEYKIINNIIAEFEPQIKNIKEINNSLTLIKNNVEKISDFTDKLKINYMEDENQLKSKNSIAILLFFLSAIGFSLMTLIFYEKSEIASKGKKIAEKNQANENSINLLIKKMNPLDGGDFTQRVYVDDKFVGKIAEKIDNTREIFGNIVKKIKNTSVLVKSTANETDTTSKNLLHLSNEHYKKMGYSIDKLGQVTADMDEVAQTAWITKEDSLKSKNASEEGSKLVVETIKKMDEIRDTIQESSKKIKKSSESAQAITEVTAIIQNITKQIEILALNAAIQAASSGDSGHEFTVVAQAVQELASNSKEATDRILELVNDVQKDIGSAVTSMEKTTQEVVTGAKLANKAGKALQEIKIISEDVASKIDITSQKIEEKSQDMANISIEMKNLQSETEKTSDIIKLTSHQVDKLKRISEELENTVHGYKVE